MKLIACLIVLSLVFAFWSSGFTSSTINGALGDHVVLEQLRSDRSPTPTWWTWDIWAERLCPPRRKPRRWRRLIILLYKLKRWYRQRVRRRRFLQREWQELMAGTSQAKQLSKDAPSATPLSAASPTIAPQPISSKEPTSATAAQEVAQEPIRPTRRGPGRPRTIPTAHRCCPNEKCSAYGRLGDDPLHDIVGCGTYTTVHGEVRQMYLCKVCRKLFSETAGTPFFNLKTPTKTVCIALQELAEGLGIRAVARIHGVEPDTVLEWLKRAGQHCEMLSQYMMQELNVTQVQLDELWTFVRKKERMLKEWEKLHSEWGDTWVWVAFDPVHKLVIAVLVGEHTEEDAIRFLDRLRSRLAEACRPLLTSDSLPHYIKAILQVFGVWIRPRRKGNRGRFPKPRRAPSEALKYATVHKERKKGRVVSVTTRIVYGRKEGILALLESVGQKINTSFVERINLTLRHLVSRLHRKTLCFSKKREYLVHHLHLALTYYHFTRYHASLRVKLPKPIPTRGNGSPKKWQQRTPAMAAGLTDHRWSLRELLMCPVPAMPG